MKSENRISSAVAETGSEVAERFEEVQSAVTENFAKFTSEAGRFIRERPWTAVGIVAAVGILIGALSRGRD
jgi:ElaB/YqjD/DUF883 family membrane-anchored ribosome-binding protein